MRLSSLVVGVFLLALGCSDRDAVSAAPSGSSFEPLALLDDWSALAPEADPLVADAAQVPACQRSAFWIERELEWIEIDSSVCSWVTLSASARGAVTARQRLSVSVSHYDLSADAPASASLRLVLGDCEAWTKTVAIPADAAVYEEQLDSPCTLPENATILFHIDNHGQNTYQLREVAALR